MSVARSALRLNTSQALKVVQVRIYLCIAIKSINWAYSA
jgi:hypothetical protein